MTYIQTVAKYTLRTTDPLFRKLLVDTIEKDPQRAALLYFDIFDRLIKSAGESAKDWEIFYVLTTARINPLSVRNADGLNPFEYFYKRNHEERLMLHDYSKECLFLDKKKDQELEFLAHRLYGTFLNFGFSKEQLAPIHKVQNLWKNYQSLIYKRSQTRRSAFIRLYKVTSANPKNATSVVDLQYLVQNRIKQEEAAEEAALQKLRQQRSCNFVLGHARGYIPPKEGASQISDLHKPLPNSNQKAQEDFLSSLQEESVCGLTVETILPAQWIKAYCRALNPPKQFERTR